jgi:VWFA-related protein
MALAASRLAAVLLLLASALAPPAAAAPAAPAGAGSDELSPRFRDWLEEVAPLLADAERDAFLALREDYQRRAFIEAFWRSRDPFPETAANELRERWEARVGEARQRFDDFADARVAAYLVHGEASTTFEARCGLLLRPVLVWAYRGGSEVVRGDFTLIFVRHGESYEAWDPAMRLGRLLTGAGGLADEHTALADLAKECADGERLAGALARALPARAIGERGELLPRPGGEWLRAFLTATTDLPGEASTFPASLSVTFPGGRGGRTVVQGLVEVTPGEATVATADGAVHEYVVDGEVLRQGELFESFRYRFRLPAATTPGDAPRDGLPLVFQRYLRPGAYRLLVRVQEVGGDRWFRDERDLEVPFPRPPAGAGAVVAAAAPADPAVEPPAAADPVAEANLVLSRGDHSLRLLPPPEGLQVGNTRVEAVATGEGIARVRFLLDGGVVMSKSRPPYSVELHLGDDLRTHEVTAVAVDERGEVLARDEITLNAGPHRFAVRLVEPQRLGRYRSSLRAQAEVHVPEGDALDRVEIYLGETLLATLYQPPFVQPVLLPGDGATTYVRAVAYLGDGNSAEDVVFVNAPENFEEVDVHLVELYTTVVDRLGRPVDDLRAEELRVLEEDVAQEVRRFERVDNVSVYAGILLDTSGSMAEELSAALAAASRFFETVIRPRDRAAVITFSNAPQLAVRFTNNPQVLAGGLAGVYPAGGTALWDSLVYSLYYFSGVQGRRALVLLSDGDDQGSHYTFDEALDYARRTGVVIYPIGLGSDANQPAIRVKLLRLAGETGGSCHFIAGTQHLDDVYRQIERELRSQYLVAYQSSLDGEADRGDGFRRVEVEVERPGAEAKTIRGYYP